MSLIIVQNIKLKLIKLKLINMKPHGFTFISLSTYYFVTFPVCLVLYANISNRAIVTFYTQGKQYLVFNTFIL